MKFSIRTLRWLLNPYLVAVVLFSAWMIFMDENNLYRQYKRQEYLGSLREKKQFYLAGIHNYKEQLAALMGNPAVQEKFAREHYYMKRDNEDVFVIVKQ